MKRNIYVIATLGLLSCSLQSCLHYDDPGAELSTEQKIDENDKEKNQGNVDQIDFSTQASEEEVKEAIEKLNTLFRQGKTGQFCMRGAKNGEPPRAHSYQFQYSLGTDCYAQYMVVPHKDFPYSNATLTSTYNISDRFNGGPRGAYPQVKNALMPLLHHPLIDRLPELKAINLLYYSLAAQEMADMSGPFSYLEDKQNLENPTNYDNLQTIYYGIVRNLDDIVACLKNFDKRPDWYKKAIGEVLLSHHETSRGIFNGDPGIKSYIALANSLKLRMAMHVVKVEPQTAQKWAEEAVAAGVVENVEEQQGLFPLITGFSHPLVEITNSWNDLRMSAALETLLMSLDHPTAKYLWKKNNNLVRNQKTGEELAPETRIVGIRSGSFVGDGQSYAVNPLQAYSTLDVNAMGLAPLYFVKYAEVCFLRAEGALRGWNMGGTAEHFYNEGIRNGYVEDPQTIADSPFLTLIEEYLKKEAPNAYVQKDPLGTGEDWPTPTKIGVKWNEADDRETKLEKIITQKYIALFPFSPEAWTDLRRTGYPKLFPVLNADDGDGTIEQGDVIRRVPWLPSDPQGQAIIQKSGLPALNGDDFQGTRLWWDTPTGNF